MKRWQVFVLILMAGLAILLFCGVAFFSRSLFEVPDPTAVARQVFTASAGNPDEAALPTPTPTTTPSPTFPATPTPTDTPIPTATPTRVVVDTATPTPSNTPTITPTPTPSATNTPVIVSGGGGGTSGRAAPAPTATPTPRFAFKITEGPLTYKTSNHIFVILAQVTGGNIPMAGYRLVGVHSPTGFQWESELSCSDLCKASGPEAIYDEDGKEVKRFMVQKGNLFFESPAYDTGIWSLMLVDSHGQQVSDVFQLQVNSDEKMWFYYHFSR